MPRSGALPTVTDTGRARAGFPPVAPALLVCAGLAGFSLLWSHTLTYDPWSWLIWGREVIHGSLVTGGGTSWKPLPVVFDTVFSLFGRTAPALWLITARVGSLMALVFAYRLATGAAGPLGGLLAVAWLVASSHSGFVFGWYGFFTSGWSEGLLVAFALAAIDAHIGRRPGWELTAWFAAVLIRPEAALFLVLAGVIAGRRDRLLWALAVALVVTAAALWILPDYLGSGQLLRGSSQALGEVPASIAHAAHPGLRDVALMRDLIAIPVFAGIVLALLFARDRVRRNAVWVLAIALSWLAVIALMTEAGYPGVPRFFVAPIAMLGVLAGGGWGLLARRQASEPLRIFAILLAVGVNGAFLAGHVADLRRQQQSASYGAALDGQLFTVLQRLGGETEVRRCGPVSTNPLEVPALAWDLGVGAQVGLRDLRVGTVLQTTIFAQQERLPRRSLRDRLRLVASVGQWVAYQRCAARPPQAIGFRSGTIRARAR